MKVIKMINSIKKILKTFQNYLKYRKLSRHNFQKDHWEEYLLDYDGVHELFGHEWGDPEDSKDRFGDYLSVKNLLISKINPNTVVLEIGSLGGKWTQYLMGCKRVIAMDINESFKDLLQKRFSGSNNLEFYVGRGGDLQGIPNGSVNLVFTMDTFTRVQEKHIRSYFKEISRVLVKNGEAILHCPNSDLPVSKERAFTPLKTRDLQEMAKSNFTDFFIDSKTLKHGSLLVVKK